MKVTYDIYPEHIGHLESDGCFRCHNDLFKAENGRIITEIAICAILLSDRENREQWNIPT